MPRLFVRACAVMALVVGFASFEGRTSLLAQSSMPPPVSREFRAVWVATVENIDWPSKRNLSVAEQTAELEHVFDLAASLNLNAVVFQIRPACDAMYASQLEPWSPYLTGEMGKGPEGGFDPLKKAVELAHERGLEIHAWYNPYRAKHASFKGEVSDNHISRTHPDWVRAYGGYLWLDPGAPEAAEHSLSVIVDTVKRYDLDGVHLDDYFYPYPVNDDQGQPVPFPDEVTYAARKKEQAGLELADWRRANVDFFVEQMNARVKAVKPWVKVGISPFGIWRPGNPESVKGLDAYATLYADSRRWLQEGWVDYLSPQLYWAVSAPAQSYPELLGWWHEQNIKGRHVWPGNYTSRIGAGGTREWQPTELLEQIKITRQLGETKLNRAAGAIGSGNVHFSWKVFHQDRGQINSQLTSDLYRDVALIPASPWLAAGEKLTADQPRLDATNKSLLTWEHPADSPLWLTVIQYRQQGKWTTKIVSSNQQRFALPTGDTAPDRVAVFQVSRSGQATSPIMIETPAAAR